MHLSGRRASYSTIGIYSKEKIMAGEELIWLFVVFSFFMLLCPHLALR